MGRIGTVNAILLVAVLMLVTVGDISAQTARIKVEGMSIDRLKKMGYANPNDWDNVTSGVTTIGVGTMSYLSAWQINVTSSGDTVVVPTTMTWVMESRPTGSTAALDFTTKQFVSFKADKAGDYKVKLTIGTSSATVTITASTYIGANRSNITTTRFNCGSCHTGVTPTIWKDWKDSPHGRKFEKHMNEGPVYWGESCFKCHTVGYNKGASNSGFDDVAATLGFVATQWTPWKAGRYDSLLTTDKKEVSLFGGIGCENCHGPYNPNHFGKGTQPKSMSADVCGQCHDEGWRHNRNAQWATTKHGGTNSVIATRAGGYRSTGTTTVTAYTLNDCVRCHEGQAFVNFTEGKEFDNRVSSGYTGRSQHTYITCQVCHDPHKGGLRSAPATSDTLSTGYNYSKNVVDITAVELGKGKLCANCHKYRRYGDDQITATTISTFWGPHYLGVLDVFVGQSAASFKGRVSGHASVENTCVGCHMQATADTGTVARDKIGMHTWKMRYTDGSGKNYDNVTLCKSCHPTAQTTFDEIIAKQDYDGNGKRESFLKEVENLKKRLSTYLPPYGVVKSASGDVDRTKITTTNLKIGLWNWLYVKNDHSTGVHNPTHVVNVLQQSLKLLGANLTGVEFVDNEIPETFELAQNYPNPFNPSTEVRFSIPKAANVRLEVYDVTGRVVATLVNGSLTAGNHQVTWNGRGLNGELVSSGVYLYRITAGSFVATKKMVLMK